ncbi:MAG TPA: helix-turn-helix domain-containing protein [Candidatus Paceibacterota bacterium]
MLDKPDSVAWSDDAIRNVCRLGTILELQAYINAGYTMMPTPMVPPAGSMREKAEDICLEYGITMASFRGRARDAITVAARTEFIAWVRKELGKTYGEIGAFLNRDHTTIVHMMRKHEDYRPGRGNPNATHCSRGHLYDDDNTLRDPKTGYRRCRACYNQLRRERTQRERERLWTALHSS